MKKLVSFMLLICMCFAFAACGKNTPAPSGSEAEPAPSSSEQNPDDQPEDADGMIATIDMRADAGADGLYDMFDNGDGCIGIIIVKTVNGEKKLFLRFIDTYNKRLTEGEYELGAWDHCFIIDRGDSHYICCDDSTVEVSGDPRTGAKVEPSDFRYSYEQDDNRMFSPDGKWYAGRTPNEPDKVGDAMLVNVETGEKTVPYVGVNNGDFEDTTASVPVGFAGDKFIFNVIGYEWLAGYGVYDLSTGETQLFDNLIDVGVFPSVNNKTDRIPYSIDRTEFGFIDLEAPGVRHPLYNVNGGDGNAYQETFNEVLEGADYFSVFSIADGKYLGVVAERESDRGMVFAAYDFRTFEKVCEDRDGDYMNARAISGNSVAFMHDSVTESRIVVVTLP